MTMTLAIVLVLAVCGITAVMTFGGWVAAQLAMRRHPGLSRERFIEAFADNGVPAEAPSGVYGYYKSGVIWRNFGVAPDDDYEETLKEAEEDIDDDAEILLHSLGLTERPELQPSQIPIRTVGEMVMWLESERKRQRGTDS